ncbi:MAG: SUMF1/EgtB/PvdO family nonheme iron enzyme [bacterium]|nr:SUMF1/EgtB/PvdO family nonheme iron enzyme [bacterium]
MRNSKTFEELREDAYAFLDGELSPSEMQAYEQLIDENIEARNFIDEIREFESELMSIDLCDEVEPPKDSWAKFQSKLNIDQMQVDIQLPEPSILDSIHMHLSRNWAAYGSVLAACLILFVYTPPEKGSALSEQPELRPTLLASSSEDTSQDTANLELETPSYETNYNETVKETMLASLSDGSEQEQLVQADNVVLTKELPSLEQILINEQELNAVVQLETAGKKWGIDKFPVTNLEYARFVRKTGHQPPFHWEGSAYEQVDAKGHKPVTYVSFEDAQAYCKWEGKRLPSQEEWEYAAGTHSGHEYPWGNEFSVKMANTNEAGIGLVEVGSYPGNVSPHGVYDMSGNVRQWVDEDFAESEQAFFTKPGQHKMMKGGSFTDTAEKATIKFSISGDKDTIYGNTGIRCVSERG